MSLILQVGGSGFHPTLVFLKFRLEEKELFADVAFPWADLACHLGFRL